MLDTRQIDNQVQKMSLMAIGDPLLFPPIFKKKNPLLFLEGLGGWGYIQIEKKENIKI